MPDEANKKRASGKGVALLAIGAIAVIAAAIVIFKGSTPRQSETAAAPQTQAASPCCAGSAKSPEPPAERQTPEETKRSAKLPRLVDLGAGKCIPCKAMAPILEDLKKSCEGKLEVEFIDVWERHDEATKYKISMIPTQIFFDADGKELFRHEGFFSKEEILAKCKELGVL